MHPCARRTRLTSCPTRLLGRSTPVVRYRRPHDALDVGKLIHPASSPLIRWIRHAEEFLPRQATSRTIAELAEWAVAFPFTPRHTKEASSDPYAFEGCPTILTTSNLAGRLRLPCLREKPPPPALVHIRGALGLVLRNGFRQAPREAGRFVGAALAAYIVPKTHPISTARWLRNTTDGVTLVVVTGVPIRTVQHSDAGHRRIWRVCLRGDGTGIIRIASRKLSFVRARACQSHDAYRDRPDVQCSVLRRASPPATRSKFSRAPANTIDGAGQAETGGGQEAPDIAAADLSPPVYCVDEALQENSVFVGLVVFSATSLAELVGQSLDERPAILAAERGDAPFRGKRARESRQTTSCNFTKDLQIAIG